jgi:rhamnosyltransferase
MTLGVLIPTLNAEKDLERCLVPVLSSPLKPKVLVLDSCSKDRTVAIARELGAAVHVLEPGGFNHGASRELGRKLLGTDVVVMLTQDIIPVDIDFLEKLVAPIVSGKADVAYARQLPHTGADVFESFPRAFNYPPEADIRSIADVKKHGVFTFFCSDSCSAYRNSALDAIGGFPTIMTNEDYFAVARILQEGGKIAYAADSMVMHSHRYTLVQEFKRYFDNGYVRAEYPWVQQLAGAAEKRGLGLTMAFYKHLLRTQPYLLPYALLQTCCKWLGWRSAFIFYKAPVWLKKKLSTQGYYFSSKYYSDPARTSKG